MSEFNMDTFLALINEDARIVITGHDVSRAIWNVVEEERTALLAKLREEVEGLDHATSINMTEIEAAGERIMVQVGFKIAVSEVLALIANLEKAGE